MLSETLGNGLTTTRGYSPQQGRLTSILTNGPNGTVQDRLFDYDNVGNLESRSDAVRAITESFGYDNLDRLTSASGGGTNITAQYDPLGNLTYRSDVGTYQYAGTRPHAVSSISGTVNTSFSYDGNGNMLSGRGSTITWFNYNLPATITKAGQTNFLYDYDHARAQQTAPDGTVTRYVNDLGIHYEKEIKGSLTEYKHSLMAGGKLIGEYVSRSDGTNSTRYFHTDHLGSIEVVTDEAGAVIARYAFDPWGKRTTVSGDGTLADQGFTGHEMLDNGFIHMGGRIYDPVIGRMLSADPYIQAPYLGQNLNRYSYVLNNPLRFTDPDGHFFAVLFAVAMNLAGIEIASAAIGTMALSMFEQAMVYGIVSGMVNTITASVLGGDLNDAFTTGFISGAMFNLAGSYADSMKSGADAALWVDGGIGRSLLHAGAGCLSGVASGSGCGNGALSAGFAELAGGLDFGGDAGKFAGRVIVGGTASVIGGGKFANGATTAAFAYLYNATAHELRKQYGSGKGHHYFPFEEWPDGLSEEAKKLFGSATSGELEPGAHVRDRAHIDYGKAVRELFENWTSSRGVNPASMTTAQAELFVKELKASTNPRIAGYLSSIHAARVAPTRSVVRGFGLFAVLVGLLPLALDSNYGWRDYGEDAICGLAGGCAGAQ
ncbi:MAG: RHS repeat-associated core domain-containing protein [Pseudomonadota bacterium]